MKPEELFSDLIAIQTFAKLYHLSTSKVEGSYATHMALSDFYNTLEDLTDSLIESYQGKYGIVKLNVRGVSENMAVIEKLKAFADMIESCTAFGDRNKNTYLYNQMDEIAKLTYQTLYKLNNLR